jgi:hypothetical protein
MGTGNNLGLAVSFKENVVEIQEINIWLDIFFCIGNFSYILLSELT